MKFGEAIDLLKAGKKVRRAGGDWDDMCIVLQVPDANSKMTTPYIYMEIAEVAVTQGTRQEVLYARAPWTPTHHAILAEDWEVVE